MINMSEMVARLRIVDGALDKDADSWKIECLALFTEIGEFVNELPWRPWRLADTRPVSAGDLDRAEKELGDIFGTIIRVAMHLGYTGHDMERVIKAHVAEKERRITAGIDGKRA